jgi:hypothetical protein
VTVKRPTPVPDCPFGLVTLTLYVPFVPLLLPGLILAVKVVELTYVTELTDIEPGPPVNATANPAPLTKFEPVIVTVTVVPWGRKKG